MLLRFDMENHERSSGFREDVLSLMRLKNFELPPLRLVRGKVVFTAVYGVGDASREESIWIDRRRRQGEYFVPHGHLW
mgnify:CR=1 FL=1|jgi:hypothetical protein